MSTFFGTQSVPNLFQNWEGSAVRNREWCVCMTEYRIHFMCFSPFFPRILCGLKGCVCGREEGLHWCEHFRIKEEARAGEMA